MAVKMRYGAVSFKERLETADVGKPNLPDNCLAVVNPELATEWHPTKNGALTPKMAKAGSGRKVWWKGKCGHEWQSVVYSRIQGSNCPYCSGQKVLRGFNDLITLNQNLASEWHPTKNGNLTPDMVTAGSHKKVWWLGKCGHEWQAGIKDRNQGTNCPYCSGRKVLKGFNDLATVSLELSLQWHPTKNGDLTPDMVTAENNKKVWWIGKCGHEWQARIADRSRGHGCPYCSGNLTIKGLNDLSTVNPELAAQWHPTKNGDLTPEMVSAGSSKKVWWRGGCGHEWEAKITDRSKGCGCPYCSGNLTIKGLNDLSTINPKLAAQWHPTKNGDLTPNMVMAGSCRKIWWIGKCGHEWEAGIADRSKGHGCPYCSGNLTIKGLNDLSTVNPELAAQWHHTKNGDLTPDMVMAGSNKKVWWRGSCGHEWEARIADRRRRTGCPICNKESKTSFPEQALFFYTKKLFPEVVNRDTSLGKELDIYIPSIRTAIEYDGNYYHNNIQRDLSKNLWCKKHGIRLIRIRESKCPKINVDDVIICKNDDDKSLEDALVELMILLNLQNVSVNIERDRVVIFDHYITNQKENSLAAKHPAIAEEWHPFKNSKIKPDMVTAGSNKKVWWKCKKGHEWQSSINSRNRGSSCPYCSKRKVLKGFNDLSTVNPELAAEWHPTKNGSLTPDMVMAGSTKKVWWQCEHGHEWQASVNNRSKGTGCPYCSGRKALKGFNDLATVNPELATEWHPTKNSDMTSDMVTSGSEKKVWWQCKRGHEWQARIADRSKGSGCPICRKFKNKQ